MSSDKRDTQFQGFAKLLWDDIVQMGIDGEYIDSGYELLIARRAYDFVKHTIIELSCQDALDFSNSDFDKYEYIASEMVEIIPDMTEWPKEEE